MFAEFKAFILRGNVLDLAVAVVIGAAFGAIVTSFTDDLLLPLIGLITGGADFTSHFIVLGPVPASYTGSPEDYAALKKAGVALFGYGRFITQVVDFLIVAFAIFMLVRVANRMVVRAAPETPATPDDVVVLREILAELKNRPL